MENATSLILYERDGVIAVVRINRPDKRNALTREMLLELGSTFERLKNDRDLRAVILTGAGERAFCVGTDIGDFGNRDEIKVSKLIQKVCDQIEGFSVPVIAAVNGIAAGAGCELVIACHIRVASTGATFSLPDAKLVSNHSLAREVGQGSALGLMLSGKTLSAAEALDIGLVNRLADPSQLLINAKSLALEVAGLAPLAIRACLQAVTQGLELPLEQGLALESELFAALFATNDAREGTNAFLEKRSPVFKGN